MEEHRKVNSPTHATDSTKEPTGISKARGRIDESESIDDLRTRLYERGRTLKTRERHSLADSFQNRRETLSETRHTRAEMSNRADTQKVRDIVPPQQTRGHSQQKQEHVQDTTNDPPQGTDVMSKKKSRKYRFILIATGLSFFVISLGISSLYLFFGNNTISGENISIDVSGPFSLGGGQEIPLQISISNRNTVPIESVVLIIEYPSGTQSATEIGRELFTDRKQLDTIGTGEILTIPIRAVVFGEENEEKIITVSVEYRVRGSSAIFFKEAEPLRFKISSSPVNLSVDSVRSISSGQELEFELTVSSNSPTPLTDILIKAIYPFGFDFTSASPETVSGKDTWFIESLLPEEVETIIIKGVVIGKQNETRVFTFSVGVANERDRYDLASVFTTITNEVELENPFLGVAVEINNEDTEIVSIASGESADVSISFKNVLEGTIYDATIQAVLSGSALDDVDILTNEGFYDSTIDRITWDFVDVSTLEEISPGKTSTVNFTIRPKNTMGRTPEIKIDITIQGQRVFENNVPQKLIGTASRVVRISSDVDLSSSALYSEGPFTNTGPTPPVAEEITQYTLLFQVDNGTNDITGAKMTAVLPQYTTWLDLVTPGDIIVYNALTREITWDIGNMDARGHEEAWVQISLLPSLSQVDKTPTIIGTQRFKATDRFTGEVIRSNSPALTTSLFNDPDSSKSDGKVLEE